MDRWCVCCRYVWCLDFKGGLFCSVIPETGLSWQRFEDNVHQVALSPSGEPPSPVCSLRAVPCTSRLLLSHR